MATIGSSAPFLAFMIADWRPYDKLRNGPAMFWTGVLTHSCAASIPVTVFFLSVNRILFITYPVTFSERQQRTVLIAAIICIFGCAGVNFLNFVASGFIFSSVPAETDCQVFACIADKTGSLTLYTETKFVSGGLNFVAGLLLLYKVWQLRVNQQQHNPDRGSEAGKKANFIAVLAIVTEFSFNFLPQFIVFLLSAFWHISAPTYAGPYNVFFTSVDSLISSSTYAKVLQPISKSQNSTVTVDNVPKRNSAQVLFTKPPDSERDRSHSTA
ncbi:serpentine type 7TM GPCR chemoreceptor srbc domain-containing protein [Ditylenchus destructor]|nr:serpentine type 7TM GPCR chemoreceptor srbc domain-containing protein [Ditylenchus destructor]